MLQKLWHKESPHASKDPQNDERHMFRTEIEAPEAEDNESNDED
jgi:hypothetical protein